VKAIAMRIEECIDSTDVSVKEDAVAGRDIFLRRFGRLAQAQNALLAVHLYCGFANHFRKFRPRLDA